MLKSQESLEEKELGMNTEQQQEGSEWVRAMGALAGDLGAVLWEPIGEGATQDTRGRSCEALHLVHRTGAIASPRLVEGRPPRPR